MNAASNAAVLLIFLLGAIPHHAYAGAAPEVQSAQALDLTAHEVEQVKDLIRAEVQAEVQEKTQPFKDMLDLAKTTYGGLVALLALIFAAVGWVQVSTGKDLAKGTKENFERAANNMRENSAEAAKNMQNNFEGVAKIIKAELDALMGSVTEKTGRLDKRIIEVEADLGKYAETCKGEIKASTEGFRRETDSSLSRVQTILNAMMELNVARFRLVRDIADVDEPSIHHPLPIDAEASVRQFLATVQSRKRELCDALGKPSSPPEGSANGTVGFDFMSGLDFVTEGKAHHYVKQHKEAVESFERALESLNAQALPRDRGSLAPPSSLRAERMEILLRLGDSYAGLDDHKAALSRYLEINADALSPDSANRFTTATLLKMKTELSKAHAYKHLMQFGEGEAACRAVQSCGEASFPEGLVEKGSAPETARRCYWESKYEQANLLVGLGKYSDARPIYLELLNNARNINNLVPVTWLHLSYADCVWKAGTGASGIDEYQAALGTEGGAQQVNKLNFHMARVRIASHEWKKAIALFQQIDRNVLSSEFSYLYLMDIFYGYALIQLGGNRADEGKRSIDKAIGRKKEEIDSPTCKAPYDCYPKYHLAMGLAMQTEGREEALQRLGQLIRRYDFLKYWAREAACADFPELKNDQEFKDMVFGPKPKQDVS